MQRLHDLVTRLYPGWPRALLGHRVQIHLASGGTWLHIETDEGLDSPVKPSALHHLHVSAEWTAAEGLTRQPVACLSVLAPTGLVTDDLGPLAFTPECEPFLFVLTAFGREDDPLSMQRIWMRAPGGKFVCHPRAREIGVQMLREWDDQIGQHWRP